MNAEGSIIDGRPACGGHGVRKFSGATFEKKQVVITEVAASSSVQRAEVLSCANNSILREVGPGLRSGDIIAMFNGVPIDTEEEMFEEIRRLDQADSLPYFSYSSGPRPTPRTVPLQVLRGERLLCPRVTLQLIYNDPN